MHKDQSWIDQVLHVSLPVNLVQNAGQGEICILPILYNSPFQMSSMNNNSSGSSYPPFPTSLNSILLMTFSNSSKVGGLCRSNIGGWDVYDFLTILTGYVQEPREVIKLCCSLLVKLTCEFTTWLKYLSWM